MIDKLRQIEEQYAGLISSDVVACELFDSNIEKAIDYLNSLVENGVLKFLNAKYHGDYKICMYRFLNEYDING